MGLDRITSVSAFSAMAQAHASIFCAVSKALYQKWNAIYDKAILLAAKDDEDSDVDN